MTGTFKIGAVGTNMVCGVMQEAIRLTEGVECSVLYSRDAARGAAFAEKNGVPAVCTDYDELVHREDVDIVYIASPNSCHFEHGMKALQAGKHVILEKPLVLTRADVDTLYQTAKEHGVCLFEAITTLFMPNYLACKSLLPALGRIKKAEIRYGQYSSKFDQYQKGIIASSMDPGRKGGALNDMGIYCIHAAIDLFGIPAGVSYSPQYGPNGVDLEGTLTMDYGAFTCLVSASKQRNIGSGFLIKGENGFISEDGPMCDVETCAAQIGEDRFDIVLQHRENRMIHELSRFRDAISNRDEALQHRMYTQSRFAVGVLEDVADTVYQISREDR